METATRRFSTTALPTPAESEEALDRAHRVFGRTLAVWASDVLELRRTGFLGQTWPVAPGEDEDARDFPGSIAA